MYAIFSFPFRLCRKSGTTEGVLCEWSAVVVCVRACVVADWSATLSFHRRRSPRPGDSVTLCQFAGAAATCRQSVPGHLQPAAGADTHHARSGGAVHRRRVADVGYSSCAAGAADARDPLQRRPSRLY